jgi:hypothetical protein
MHAFAIPSFRHWRNFSYGRKNKTITVRQCGTGARSGSHTRLLGRGLDRPRPSWRYRMSALASIGTFATPGTGIFQVIQLFSARFAHLLRPFIDSAEPNVLLMTPSRCATHALANANRSRKPGFLIRKTFTPRKYLRRAPTSFFPTCTSLAINSVIAYLMLPCYMDIPSPQKLDFLWLYCIASLVSP